MDIKKYLQQLELLVNIDCGTHNYEGIKKVADYLIDWYKEIDWQIKIHDTKDENYKVYEIFNHDDSHYDVMFIGHLDTVFPDGTVSKRPFKIIDDVCYGPGVNDMKNGVLAMLHIGENLDYSQVNYVNMHTKVKIICHELRPDGTEYGEFWQEPVVHLKGCSHRPRKSDFEKGSLSFRSQGLSPGGSRRDGRISAYMSLRHMPER